MDKDIKNLYEITLINSKSIKKNAIATILNSISIALLAIGIFILIALRR